MSCPQSPPSPCVRLGSIAFRLPSWEARASAKALSRPSSNWAASFRLDMPSQTHQFARAGKPLPPERDPFLRMEAELSQKLWIETSMEVTRLCRRATVHSKSAAVLWSAEAAAALAVRSRQGMPAISCASLWSRRNGT